MRDFRPGLSQFQVFSQTSVSENSGCCNRHFQCWKGLSGCPLCGRWGIRKELVLPQAVRPLPCFIFRFLTEPHLHRQFQVRSVQVD